jgi:hypothetical protein
MGYAQAGASCAGPAKRRTGYANFAVAEQQLQLVLLELSEC